ncbi:hypothetical protein [Methylorubrum sp. SB2]|uniref:hypothetical protein n=1 Tax=Methylorubrum subtropicum TaxID=3138812 RepID=UPI00313DF939
MDFYVPAKGYAEAAKIIVLSPLRESRVEMTYLPIHMLLGFSVELYLKSWLCREGIHEDILRKKPYGHDLGNLYKEATSRNLKNISGLDHLVQQLHGPHTDFTYRYFRSDLIFDNTDFRSAFEITDRLDVEVDTHIGASASHGLQPGH